MSNQAKMRETIGSNILQQRRAADLTQEQLAAIIGTKPGHISHWERGVRLPVLDSIFRLCLALDCELEDLLGVAPEWKEWVK